MKMMKVCKNVSQKKRNRLTSLAYNNMLHLARKCWSQLFSESLKRQFYIKRKIITPKFKLVVSRSACVGDSF